MRYIRIYIIIIIIYVNPLYTYFSMDLKLETRHKKPYR